jgi:trk system potassium uptake protein TrkH
VVRHPRVEEIGPVRVTVSARKVQSRLFGSPLVLLYIFAALVAVGTALLIPPFAHHGSGTTPFMDALFTSTSAVTVTGLVVQDTATYWTLYGKAVVLGLMFVGGLGIMTLAAFLLVLLGQRVSLFQRLLMKESLGILPVNELGGLVRLAIRIVIVAVAIQFVGFIALTVRFLAVMDPVDAVGQGLFLAVSGFNNAGFTALPESASLSAYQTDVTVIVVMGLLILLGGISLWVMADVVTLRRFSLFSLNTKLVLVTTAFLVLLGSVVFFSFEYGNQPTLQALSVPHKLLVSVFESISGRTAGFSTVDYGETEQHTNFIFISLMFIGGASASVAGGIKVNTFAVVLVAVLSTLRGRTHATAFGREIPVVIVQRAMVIGAVAIAVVFFFAFLLTAVETGFDFIDLLFESVSAFGTVGLSTGLTGDLSRWGQLILVVAMFVGRVGPLGLGLAMAQYSESDNYRYAQERVTIG